MSEKNNALHADSRRHENTKVKSKRINCTILFLALVALYFYPAGLPTESGNRSVVALSDISAEAAVQVPNQTSYLDGTAWPTAFQITMLNYVGGARGKAQNPVPGVNALYYDATNPDSLKMKAVFPSGTHIPGVPLSFVGKECVFYLGKGAPNSTLYQAAVYCPDLKEYFRIGTNVGPVYPDFVARYHKILPIPPLHAPFAKSDLPVGNPAGVLVQWFVTSGLCVPSAPEGEGYYAALATPIQGANNVSYKPPYSFTGLGVGLVHNRRGQLVYDTQSFNLNPSFSPDTFTPPTGYTQLPAQSPPINATKFNCAVCHASDPPHKVTLYVPEIKKPQPTRSKTAEK